MLEMQSELTYVYRYARAENRRVENTTKFFCANSSNVKIEGSIISAIFAGFGNDCRGYEGFFVAAPTAPPFGSYYRVTYDGTGVSLDGISGDNGTRVREVGNVARWISDSGDSGVVEAYNRVYGESLTRVQVFAKLQEIYGDTYNFFGWVGFINFWTLPYISGVSESQWSFLPDPSNTAIEAKATNSWTTSSISDAFVDCFEYGLEAIDPEYLPNIRLDDFYDVVCYFAFAPAPLPPEKLIFDVYVDGVIGGKAPSIQIKWRNNRDDSLLSPSLIKPHIWGAGLTGEQSGDPINLIHTVDGILVPDDTKTPFNTTYNFDDEGYMTTYIGASDTWYSDMSDLERVLLFGFDKIPNMLCYLLRFDYEYETEQWGDLWYVYIPYEYEGAVYCEHAAISNSANNTPFETEVNVIGGEPPEEVPDDPDEPEAGEDDNGDPSPIGAFDPDAERIDFSESTPEGYTGNAVLTKTYCVTALNMQNVGAKLWSQSYFDVLKVQTNPIENIIACKWFPFSVSGSSENIQIGDVPFDVYGDVIPSIKVIPFTNTFKHTPTANREGYLSCSPYTMIKLHLPYCGVVQLDATELLDRTLDGKYVIDLITGDVLVILTLSGFPFMNIAGKMGVDIPLSATNRAQTELGIANKALSATLGAAAHTIGGDYLGAAGGAGNGILSIMGMDYTTQRSGTHSPACSTYEDRSVWVEVIRSIAYKSEGYRSGHGYPCHLYRQLQKGQGYVQIDKGARISVAMTDEENRELETIMQRGFYV